MAQTKDISLEILTLFERANHYVKEGNWYLEDKEALYKLKDLFLTKFYNNPPENVKIELSYVPYYKYSNESKDKAGNLMRLDGNKQPFEYYLSQIEPGPYDIEIIDKATIEMQISYNDRTWCFHIPQSLTSQWNITVSSLPKKVWINGRDFHHQQFLSIEKEAKELLGELQ